MPSEANVFAIIAEAGPDLGFLVVLAQHTEVL